MWHEARRQERKIRGMLVDYRRRAERRRDFYEKIKADPTQFLQIHGRQCKIHLDPAIAAAADSTSAMMPWQGQADNLIDRFDVRAHLDYIPPVKKDDDEELTFEERQINYERYRIIAQNSFLGITEEKFLKQLHLEEQYGYTELKIRKDQQQQQQQQPPRNSGVQIGFNYEDNTAQIINDNAADEESGGDGNGGGAGGGGGGGNNSDSDLDVDLSINVSKMDSVQAHEMNRHGRNFGMSSNDFYSFLTNDLEEAESFRLAKEEEHEKALFSGRKSRRERRAHREKRLANRVISPPSYAARTSPTYPSFRESKSLSKSPSPENAGKITYITSFGDEEEPPTTSKATNEKTKNRNKKRQQSTERVVYICKRRSYSKERYNNRKRYTKSRSRSRSRTRRRSRSRNRYRKSRSRSRGRTRSYRKRSSSSSVSSTSSSSSSSASTTSSSTSSSSSSSLSSSTSSTPTSLSKTPPKTSMPTSPPPPPLPPPPPPPPVPTQSMRRSKSASPVRTESPPKIVRYYGRRKSDQSSSELSDSSDKNEEIKPSSNSASGDKWSGHGNSGNVTKKTGQNLSIQERLKRKRQALLNKQFKADKIAEQLKTEREKQEQQNREDELREMAIKLRRRQREKRHAYDSRSSNSSDSDSTKSRSPLLNNRNKSKSPSPCYKRDDYRENRRRRSSNSRSPCRYNEKRYVYRERRDRRRDDYDRERREGSDKDRDRASRSLVDY